ncbi:hypothetical protein HN51_054614 [Arachis hypogaea]|uniref:WAT1-related protein n=1 Tax=Arachis hypogaea TaxID=3818 RepID=A0A444XJE8_ARAHY|nr:WAT1-related protein At1g09380-like [Arachis ipaensis]XP_025676900.1 WAT1-related protein At1g09380 [Arachis hypogaea]QHN77209.1 WAT1-related protein [Arachis hypogaea]RYQ89800.1 hypothetical protein Ahy_B09g096259 isoform A [Arachis hypogaea]
MGKVGGVIPFLAMAIVQSSYAGMTITSKLAIQSGMSPLVLVAYRQIFATLSLAPFAYWFERNTLPCMTKRTGLQILISSFTGVTGNQILYFVGLKYSTATIATALTNLLPAFTFILAVLCRQELLRMKTRAGQAKVLGTVLSVGGALLLSFYHGKPLGLGDSGIHWKFVQEMDRSSSSTTPTNLLLGPFALIASSLVWSVWFILQAEISKNYAAPYTSSLYMCMMASIQCVAIALCSDRTVSAWSLNNPIRLSSALYAGIVCTGIGYGLMAWTIERKGPLYVSVFTPLTLVITALLTWALLHDQLYVGTAIGSVIIVLGLYAVLWGKSNEKMNKKEGVQVTSADSDSIVKDKEDDDDEMSVMEMQCCDHSNCNHNSK